MEGENDPSGDGAGNISCQSRVKCIKHDLRGGGQWHKRLIKVTAERFCPCFWGLEL